MSFLNSDNLQYLKDHPALTALAGVTALGLARNVANIADYFYVPARGHILEMSSPAEVAKITHFNEKLVDPERKIVVLYFYASWCPSCRRVSAMLPQWAALMPNTLFAKINIDKGQFASMSSLAPRIPTFYTMDGTQVLNKFVGSEKVPMMMEHLKSIDDKKSLMMRLQADIKEREKKVRQAPRAAPKTTARKASSKPVSRKAVREEEDAEARRVAERAKRFGITPAVAMKAAPKKKQPAKRGRPRVIQAKMGGRLGGQIESNSVDPRAMDVANKQPNQGLNGPPPVRRQRPSRHLPDAAQPIRPTRQRARRQMPLQSLPRWWSEQTRNLMRP